MSILINLPYFSEKIWAALLGVAGILGLFLAGYQIGESGFDRKVAEVQQRAEKNIITIKEIAARDISRIREAASKENERVRIEVERRLVAGERRVAEKLSLNSKSVELRIVGLRRTYDDRVSRILRRQIEVVEDLKSKHVKELDETRRNAAKQAAQDVRIQNLSSQQQLKQLATLIAIMTKPSIEKLVTPEVNEIVRQVSFAIPNESLTEARLRLPENVRLEPERLCVKNGEFAMMKKGSKFTNCEKNIVAVLVSTQPSYAIIAVDGIRNSVRLGTKRNFPKRDCTVFFSNFSKIDGDRLANVSMDCGNN